MFQPRGVFVVSSLVRRCAFLLAVTAATVTLHAQITRNPLRSLTGNVSSGHEPIRGAVVQIEAEDTKVIQSYVTDERGTYHFRNLRSDADFQVWATFRGHRSKTHEMNKFDKKADREIELEIDLTKD